MCGNAGSGKSVVLKFICREFAADGKDYVVLTKTNNHRVNLGDDIAAVTTNSFLRIGIPRDASSFHSKGIKKMIGPKMQLLFCICLEEAGMAKPDEMEYLNFSVNQYCEKEGFMAQKLFVCGGDLAQLMPIPGKNTIADVIKMMDVSKDPDKGKFLHDISECHCFLFQSDFWRQANFDYVVFHENYRTSSSLLQKALDDLMFGEGDTIAVKQLLEKVEVPFKDREGYVHSDIQPTEVYGTNKEISKVNLKKLQALDIGTKKLFQSLDFVQVHENVPNSKKEKVKIHLQNHPFFTKNVRAPMSLELRVDAQVVLSRPIRGGLVTGNRGVVRRYQIMTLIRLVGDDNPINFRVATLSDARKFGCDNTLHIPDNKEVVISGRKWTSFPRKVCLPVVYFHCDKKEHLVGPVVFTEEVFMEGTLVRHQIPLPYAWAVTTYSLQGSELDYMILNMKHCWEFGMGYSGIGRAMSDDGLHIVDYKADKVRCHSLVKGFYSAVEKGKDGVNRFLEEEAGMWWYPLLSNPEILKRLCVGKGPYTDLFKSWVWKHRPKKGYVGWSAPKSNDWYSVLFDDKEGGQCSILQFVERSSF
jgi:hypothetical protein